jgi:hypothetical protein
VERKKPIWLWALVVTSFVAAFFALLHLIDDLSRAGTGTISQVVIGVTTGLLALVWLLAITLSLRQEPGGYVVVLILGLLGMYLAFDHIAGLSPSVAEIVQTSGIFFAWVLVNVGAASVLAILLASYGLVRGQASRRQEA